MFRAQLRRQFVNRQAGLRRDPAPHPVTHVGQLAATRVALRLRLKRTSLALEPNHIIDELDRNAQPPGCLNVRVSLFYKSDGAFP
jgi:hypothetical protein